VLIRNLPKIVSSSFVHCMAEKLKRATIVMAQRQSRRSQPGRGRSTDGELKHYLQCEKIRSSTAVAHDTRATRKQETSLANTSRLEHSTVVCDARRMKP